MKREMKTIRAACQAFLGFASPDLKDAGDDDQHGIIFRNSLEIIAN
jgi:hypothetical protein